MLHCQGRLYMSCVDGMSQWILAEAHSKDYSIHSMATKMYHDLREIYWRSGKKRDIAEFVAKCSTC